MLARVQGSKRNVEFFKISTKSEFNPNDDEASVKGNNTVDVLLKQFRL
jgi:hypothetical protein